MNGLCKVVRRGEVYECHFTLTERGTLEIDTIGFESWVFNIHTVPRSRWQVVTLEEGGGMIIEIPFRNDLIAMFFEEIYQAMLFLERVNSILILSHRYNIHRRE
ncbi:unnamed protein product [Caenorhabditis angaria]|uniref:Uncharacterized protein n=1 Tax=Caenorhabditis angaria TaxID=860376 RepID=A0A9P1IVF2_9PELO|nr:unnamed protein product [Caenorhabditis angaria]